MINLIPPEARSRIITEYWVRVGAVWLLLLGVAATAIATFLLPAYVLVGSQAGIYEVAAKEASTRVAEQEVTTKVLVEASTQAKLLVDDADKQSMMEFFDVVQSLVDPNLIEIKSYSLTRKDMTVQVVQVRGHAATRLSLSNFRDALTQHPLIEKVNLPISNLAKDRDIEFSIALTIATSTPPL